MEVEKLTVSVTRKKKRDNDEELSITENRPKVAAIEIGVQAERKIRVTESEESRFLDVLIEALARSIYICGVNNRIRSQADKLSAETLNIKGRWPKIESSPIFKGIHPLLQTILAQRRLNPKEDGDRSLH
jgi:hypothetical protein